jgi:hypothetical protein
MSGQTKLLLPSGGSITIVGQDTASNFVVTLPANTGTVVTTGSTAVVTPAMMTQPLTVDVAKPTTSGTAIGFTGIPSWVKRVTVLFSALATNGSSIPIIQLGNSTYKTSGYVGGVAFSGVAMGASNFSSGFMLSGGWGAPNVMHGSIVLNLISSNTWIASIVGGFSQAGYGAVGSGTVSLTGTLDRIQLTITNGTDVFTAGSMNILYEG